MMKIVRSDDMALVKAITTDPHVWPAVSDDGCPPPRFWSPPQGTGIYYLLPILPDGQVGGLFRCDRRTLGVYEVHTCLLPIAWGPVSVPAALAARRWMRRHAQMHKIITWIPAPNRRAARFAERCGLTLEGRSPQCWRKGGVFYDMVLYGWSA